MTNPRPAGDQQPEPAQTRLGGIPAGRIFGVPLVVSPAWFVLVAFALLVLPSGIRSSVHGLSNAGSYGVALALVVLVYGAVLIHEASHVLVAKALGMRVGRVVLQLLGAASEVLDEPNTPGKEYLVAAVGPLTSVLLAGIAAAIGGFFPDHSVGWLLASSTAYINGIVAAFNLLPGLPLDGGRLLRAALWQITGDKLRGLLIAGWVGRTVAAGVAIVGLVAPTAAYGDRVFGSFYLFLVAFFIWTNASISIAQARVGTAIPQLDLSNLVRPALTVDGQLPLAEAVRRAREIGARGLVVVDSRERWAGIVSEAAVQATPASRQPWMPVSELARPMEDGLVLDPRLNGADLLSALQRTPATEYLVADEGGLRGVLARVDLIAALRAAGVH
ncbi:MAG TPA: site-2 protease family protein [Mycobacteriales bacterium]|nr:site-2 protease family protein [Mycobacteriales bacterium]